MYISTFLFYQCRLCMLSRSHCNTQLQWVVYCRIAVCCDVLDNGVCVMTFYLQHTATHCNTLQHTATLGSQNCRSLQEVCGSWFVWRQRLFPRCYFPQKRYEYMYVYTNIYVYICIQEKRERKMDRCVYIDVCIYEFMHLCICL